MKLNRELQREILLGVTEAFPRQIDQPFLVRLNEKYGESEVDGNLLYLCMHGLLDLNKTETLSGKIIINKLTPTEKAFDFLADDGGLSAVLGVVTIKLHADTIRDLIASRIASSDIPIEQKNSLQASLRSLPDEALKHLTTKLVDAAFDNLPAAMLLLGKFFSL
jgi:hypothetical protein